MNHLNELELIVYFYGESPQPGKDREHLKSCCECAAVYEALKRDIALGAADIEAEPVPARETAYGEAVWRLLKPSLEPYQAKQSRRLWWLPQSRAKLMFALVSTAAVLALVAFLSGRLWEQRSASHDGLNAARGGSPSQPTPVQPVIVVLLSDHLERSERLLVELNHPDEAIVDPALQATARQLLAENRRYQQDATRVGSVTTKESGKPNSLPREKGSEAELSPAMTLTLDDLDRVLAQVADQPDGLSRAEIAQVKQQINASGLLFEVRILRSRTHHMQTGAPVARRDGTA